MKNLSKWLLAAGLIAGPMAANATVTGVTGSDDTPLVYDSLNDVTWTANANLFASQYSASTVDTIIADAVGLSSLKDYTLSSNDFSSDGQMTWYGAEAWVHYLNVTNYGGSDKWALPKTVDSISSAGYPDGIGADPSPSTSQLATLFYSQLGQVAGVAITTTNNGAAGFDLFSNMPVSGYSFFWGSTPDTFAGAPRYRWSFNTDGGSQYGVAEKFPSYVLAETPGQVISAPTVTPTVTGTVGTNGWYVSLPTKLTWTVLGKPAPVRSGCGTFTVPDTTGKTYTCSATNEQGNASVSVTIKKDSVPPEAVIRKPANDATYTLNQHVLASYTCTDKTSGVASCLGTVADGTSVPTSVAGTQTFNVTATDNAGNTTLKSVSYMVQ
jgi:hypothetical protein